jgi:hypothetical protein
MGAGSTFQILFWEPTVVYMNLKILPDIRERFVAAFNTRLAPLVSFTLLT